MSENDQQENDLAELVPDPYVTVFTETGRGEPGLCRLAALGAARIPAHLTENAGAWSLRVPIAWESAARQELAEYEQVNRNFPPPQVKLEEPTADGTETAAALMTSFLFIVFFLGHGPGGHGWVAGAPRATTGAAEADAIVNGEWWRAVTALTLHADFAHVLSNAVCLFFFGRQVFLRLGWGLGWLVILATGFLGNLTAAYLGQPGRASIGVSTATFGALGFLCLTQAIENYRRAGRWGGIWNRSWLPIAAGAALLGLLGTSPGSDLYGHAYGFIAGILLALPLAWSWFKVPPAAVQVPVGLGAWSIIWICWWLALRPG